MVFDALDRRRLMDLYEQRLAADPESRAFLPLAELYRGEARHEDARQVLETGLVRHPGFVSAMVALAQVRLDVGEETLAQEMLVRVVARDPDNLVALRLLAAAAENRADWAGACGHLERVLRLDAADFEAAARLDAARRQAEAACAAVVAAPAAPSPTTTAPEATVPTPEAASNTVGGVVTLTLADLYLRQGYNERARALLDRMAAAEPHRQDVRERLERLDRAEPAAPSTGMFGRRRTAAERHDERHRFENWLERAGEE